MKYRTDPDPPHNWIPIDEWQAKMAERDPRNKGPLVFGDLPDVVSPIDGSVIHGRKGFRDHFRRHNVTWADDFKETWQQEKKERERLFNNPRSKRERIEALKYAFDKHRRR